MMSSIKKLLGNPAKAVFLLNRINLGRLIPDRQYIKVLYRATLGEKLNLSAPASFNEKLQWLKIHDRRPGYIQMVDKVEAKKYAADIIGNEYIIPDYGVWNDPDEIDFQSLPDQFVIKCNHCSGRGIYICKDKATFDVEAFRKQAKKDLRWDYYPVGREWPYKNIERKLLAETYLVDESGYELKDYKFHCMDGRVRVIQVDYDRFQRHKRNMYTPEWEWLDFSLGYPSDRTRIIPKPKRLDTMIACALELSRGYPYVRVDFYTTSSAVFFGELTLYHGSGLERFVPEEWNRIMGDWLVLPPGINDPNE